MESKENEEELSFYNLFEQFHKNIPRYAILDNLLMNLMICD